MTWPTGAHKSPWVATRHCPGASCAWTPSWARIWWSGCWWVPGTPPCFAAARPPCLPRAACCTGGLPCCWGGRSLTPTRCPGWWVSGVSSAVRSRTSRVCTPAACTKTTCSRMSSRWRKTVSSRGRRSWEPPVRIFWVTSGRPRTKWGRGWRMSLRFVYFFVFCKLNYIFVTQGCFTNDLFKKFQRENIWTIPNILCVSRIVASPYLGYLIIQEDFKLAFGLFTLAGITDMVTLSINVPWDPYWIKFIYSFLAWRVDS